MNIGVPSSLGPLVRVYHTFVLLRYHFVCQTEYEWMEIKFILRYSFEWSDDGESVDTLWVGVEYRIGKNKIHFIVEWDFLNLKFSGP